MLNDNSKSFVESSPLITDVPKDLTTSSPLESSKPSSSERQPTYATSGSYVARPNQVSTVLLHGVPIVSLYIDGKERLCLAQISNTLLKQYSYNEIHNRRVALGITCVQCTPVQLEILRRAGAMPISSRRCGMITMREAERLVKSFLEENLPPKLPENFSFHVKHECGWGCEGFFEPSRYNSSRAKCIKCKICNMYFSPNKFIFHFHRTQEAKYSHPDAANFNSWRRHLKLYSTSDEGIVHAWEDVKAMFNGGSRKRILSTESSPTYNARGDDQHKKPKLSSVDLDIQKEVFQSPYPPFSLLPQQRKSFQFSPVNQSPPTTFALPFGKECMTDVNKASPIRPPTWPGLHGMFPTYNLLWNNPFVQSFRNDFRESMMTFKGNISRRKEENYNDDESSSSAGNSPRYDDSNERFSAFRLVNQNTRKDSVNSPRTDSNDSEDESEEINITDFVNGESNEEERDLHSKLEDKVKEDTHEKKVLNKIITDGEDLSKTDTEMKRVDNNKEISNVGIINVDPILPSCNRESPPLPVSAMEMTKEEIQREVQAEMEIRKQMEKEIQALKEALTNELEQERQVRFSLQQKLKEAHDALHNFSCKMLASRKCDECEFKDNDNPVESKKDS
ncbi:SKI family transcriptional corepressor 1 homolog-B-like [Saccostrea cucullata]|uniref:SKI family transcriptional corepressor 1 homolog-B-like n=1 Tax=Saccostrea cuccullata TaxID=36930 RepID=UPI002ED04899